MSGAERRPVVVLLALQGDRAKIRESIKKAESEDLMPVVYTTEPAKTSLQSDIGATGGDIRISGVASYPLTGVRRRIRASIEDLGASLAMVVYRLTRAARHRLQLPAGLNDFLEKGGAYSQRLLPGIARRLADRVFDPGLRITGFIATKLHHCRVVAAELRVIVEDNAVVGVACLDDASLLPGWLISRRYPALAVIAGFPDRWDRETEMLKDLFDSGSAW